MWIFVQWRSTSDVMVVQFAFKRVHVSFPPGQNWPSWNPNHRTWRTSRGHTHIHTQVHTHTLQSAAASSHVAAISSSLWSLFNVWINTNKSLWPFAPVFVFFSVVIICELPAVSSQARSASNVSQLFLGLPVLDSKSSTIVCLKPAEQEN